MLVEIQFLLDSFLKAKKMGHKFYSIERRSDLVDSVNNIINKTYNNYENYKNKIIGMINDENINQFSKQLILKPNVVLSYITSFGSTYAPLLHTVGSSQNHKMIELYLDCLLHSNNVILKQKYDNTDNDKNYTFWLKKYVNFNKCKWPIIDNRDGINRSRFVKYRYTLHIVSDFVFLCVYYYLYKFVV